MAADKVREEEGEKESNPGSSEVISSLWGAAVKDSS